MHADFPKLYSEISTDGAQRALRWSTIEAIAKRWTRAKAEMLVRLAFGTKSPPGGHQDDELAVALAEFQKAFSDADPSMEKEIGRIRFWQPASFYSTSLLIPRSRWL